MDHPTRRLDETVPPDPHRCSKCGNVQIHAYGGAVVLMDSRTTWISRRTTCDAWVCRECGFVEWYAENPAALES